MAGGCLAAGWLAAVGGRVSAQQHGMGAQPPTGAPFDASKVPPGLAAPKMWTAQQDHQDMMDQLGIKALRPGPNGNESAPNHANYDEATANPYPDLPERPHAEERHGRHDRRDVGGAAQGNRRGLRS